MNFSMNETEQAIVDTVAEVSKKVLKENAQAYDEAEAFCVESLKALGELGCMGINLPEEYGGLGISSIAMSHIVAEVTAGCASTASTLTAHFLATDSILIGATEEQKQQYLPRCADGTLLGAFGLTEPAAGSNPAGMLTKAKKENDGWRIQGSKHYITNGAEADFIILYAKTNEELKHKGISAFIIPKGTEGVHFSKPEKTMGLKGSHIYEIAFDCWVPDSALMGQEGTGFSTAMEVLDRGRVEVAAMALGISKAAIEYSLLWVKERMIGGKPLSSYQNTQWKIAEMHTQYEAAELLTMKAAFARDYRERYSLESATAKLFASEACAFITDTALQLHGGYGFIRDLPLERFVRDARILRIFEGTSEIQKMIISRSVILG